MTAPFFSIGITTYNRHDLLREALLSILGQDFGDFEVIVGNDYQAETLTLEMLGIDDPRIRIINHPVNLREVGNMNALLAAASGRYFTWLFDDDLYEPGFLGIASRTLAHQRFPSALYTSYRVLRKSERFVPRATSTWRTRLHGGAEFLDSYRADRPQVISTCALFDREELLARVGGVEELCASAIGVYCEYLFLVRCALLERIVCIDAPLVVFRAHAGSWGVNNAELEKYQEGGEELLRRCAAVLAHPPLSAVRRSTLRKICNIHLSTFASKCARVQMARGEMGMRGTWRSLQLFRDEVKKIEGRVFLHLLASVTLRDRIFFMLLKMKCRCMITGMLAVNRLRARRG